MRVLIAILFYSSLAWAQSEGGEIDSLKFVVATTKVDTIKIKTLLKLEYAYRFTDYKKGLQYADEALKLARKLDWDRGLALYYNNIGGGYLDRGQHAKALDYFTKSLEYSVPYPKMRLTTFINISNIYLREKNFRLSHKYNDKAFQLAERLNDTEEVAYCYYQFGLISRDQGKMDEAAAFYKKSLKLFREHNNVFQIAELTTFLGEVTADYKQKLEYIKESKELWDELMPDYISAVYNSITLAKTYIELAGDESLKKASGVEKNNTELLTEAEVLLLDAIKQSALSNTKQNLMESYGALAQLKALTKDYATAYNYQEKYDRLKDSIFSQESKNKIAGLESAKEIAQRDNEIKINRLTLKSKERQKWFFIVALALLAIIGGLLFQQSRNRKKNNIRLQVLNTHLDEANKTKLRFLSILNHDLRRPVSSFIHYIQFQDENPGMLDDESKQRIEQKTVTTAKNLLHSMEDILLWAKDQMDNFKIIPVNINVQEVFDDTQNHFSSEKQVQLTFEDPEKIAMFTDVNYLKTIIRNLTANAIKATENAENPIIAWKAWRERNATFLSVTDNGKGTTTYQLKALYDENQTVGMQTGLGLHLIRDLAKAINCRITIQSVPGSTTFILEF